MNPNLFTTLEEARQYIAEHFHTGVACPCCKQQVKLYEYRLYGTSAVALIKLYNLTLFSYETEFHVREYAEATSTTPRASHFAELRFWGLIEKSPREEKGKKSSGYWSITEKGKQFVRAEITIPEKIKMFNNEFHGFIGGSIDIHHALGNQFNYDELFKNAPCQS